jgi:hypothetical protein
MAGSEPFVADPEMIADAEPQPVLESGLTKQSDDILLRPHLYRIPLIVFGIPKIEIIVVNAHTDEILCASFFVERKQMVRVELVSPPGLNHNR